ncbi:MAG: hypothetical protein AAF614_01765 [Chloroflexota bacterium]
MKQQKVIMYSPYISPAQSKARHDQLLREAARHRQLYNASDEETVGSFFTWANGRLATIAHSLRRANHQPARSRLAS